MKWKLKTGSYGCIAGLCAFSTFLQSNAAEADTAGANTRLPLAEVILYSSGVGYYERQGEVEGNAQAELRFKTEDINDLLKSLVVQDLDGGRVTTVTYASRDPIERKLRSFGIDLTSNFSLGQLLIQLRGEKVEVSLPNVVTGTIISVEKRPQPAGDAAPVEAEFVNLLTQEGMVSVPLSEVRRIQLLDKRLNQELQQALEVLASSHDNQRKTVSISFEGEGKRKVSVAYIAQAPVWKTSYRLVLEENEDPYLQGWAIVENTSDEDWENVRLALVSGRPISFTMDLYEPLYTQRPEVQLELYSSLRPQVYSEVMEERESLALKEQAPAAPAQARSRGAQLQAQGGMTPQLARRYGLAPESLGVQGATAGGVAGIAAGERFNYDQDTKLGRRLSENVAAAAQGDVAGELFQYAIQVPVSLARQSSAMLPIVSEKVKGAKVSIYNERVHAKYPLNGFRLKNTTALHLLQGPITVFEDGSYAGDAQIEDLAAGQERLISYSLDLKTEVEPQAGDGEQRLVDLRLRKGTAILVQKLVNKKTYKVRNRDQEPKALLIEHPFRSDWELVEPKEAKERTRDVYRFGVTVEPDKTESLVVHEQKQITEQIQLTNFDNDTLLFYIRSKEVGQKVKEALQEIVRLRDRINQTAADRARKEQRFSEISQEQARIRENMQRLSQTSDLYGRYVKKLDEQETELEQLRREIEAAKLTEAKQQRELDEFLLNLDVG